jgi:squalene-hopene/tetraprenyl-beta-curcumene cyclase
MVPMAVLFACSVVAAQASHEQKAQALIDKGLDFLKSQQKPDGGWQGDRDPPGITALVLRSFVQDANYKADTDFIKRGYDKLLSYQVPDGGIYQDALANYNTAIAISALSAAEGGQYKSNIDKAVAYLKGLQWTEMVTSADGQKISGQDDAWYGGWGYGGRSRGGGRPDLSNVQMALDALHDAGIKPDDPAFKAALKFVGRLQNSSETNDQPWAGNDGGFVYGPSDNRKGESAAGEFTTPDGQRRLRSYGSMTYAGLKSFIYAGLTKDDQRVRAAWDWITKNWTLDENPGMRAGNPEQAQNGMYYYYHTLARALNEYDEPTITDAQGKRHDWRVELIDKLASLQKPDGSWVGEQRWMESNPILTTSYVVMALQEAQKDLKQHPPGQ